MVEYHINDVKKSHTLPEVSRISDGGHLSVRKEEKFPGSLQELCWGHDEAVAHGNSTNSLLWHGSEGEQPLLPKSLGPSFHTSGFTNEQKGWNPTVTPEQLEEINSRRRGTKYLAEESATDLYGSPFKKDLELQDLRVLEAFVWVMKPGKNDDGYWTLKHQAIQLENLQDVCEVLYPPEIYQHKASFDNSQNHRGKRPNGLNAPKMNVGWGGAQPKIHSTEICTPEDFIGPLCPNVGVLKPIGARQRMVFEEDDDGPCFLNAAEKAESRNCRVGIVKTRTLRSKVDIAKLVNDHLESTGETTIQELHKKSLQTIRGLARRYDLSVKVSETRSVAGWIGEPIGLYHCAAERGLIDSTRGVRHYSKDFLANLIGRCPDFKNEICLLEWIGRERGWIMKYSAKGYPCVAGRGVEYIWALVKNYIRRIPLSDRKGAEKFEEVFFRAISEIVLTPKAVRGWNFPPFG